MMTIIRSHPNAARRPAAMPDRCMAGLLPMPHVGMKVLVVEDHLQVRHVVVRALRGAGYEVCEAESGASAVEQAGIDRVDAAVIDISQPGELHGVGFGRRLRQMWAGVPIVFVTGLMDWEMPEPVPQDGTTRLLHKPFGALEIVGLVNGLVSARSGLGGMSLGE